MARAARYAGLDKVRPHQLRYLAATAMQAAGASLAEIGQVLRHEDERTTSLYANPRELHQAGAFALVGWSAQAPNWFRSPSAQAC